MKMGVVAGELIKNFFINKADGEFQFADNVLIDKSVEGFDHRQKFLTVAEQLEEGEVELDYWFGVQSIEEDFKSLFKFKVMEAENFLKANWD